MRTSLHGDSATHGTRTKPLPGVRPRVLSRHACLTLFLKKAQEPQSGFTGLNGTKEGERRFLPFSSLPLGQCFQGSLYPATGQPRSIPLSLFSVVTSTARELGDVVLTRRKEAGPSHANTQQGSKGIGRTIEVSEILFVALINKHASPRPQLQQKCASLSSKWKELTAGLAVCGVPIC